MAFTAMASLLRDLCPVSLALLLLSVVSLYCAVALVLNHRKLRQFSGPPLAGFSRAWLFWQSIHANVAEAQFDALRKYGCPARLGPDLLVVDDPDIIRHFNLQRSGWRRSKWYESMRFDPRLDTVFSTRDEKIHADLRAREVAAYNGRDVDTLETDIDTRIKDLVDLLRTKYNGVTMDMAHIARFFTLDVLSTIAFGRPFGFMAANDDLWGYSVASGDFVGVLELASNHAFFFWLLNTRLMRYLFAPKPSDARGMGPALAFSQKAVAERFGPNRSVKKDMLGHFVEHNLTQLRCETEAFLQIIAGSDSTTTVLRCTMYLLVSNPTAYSKLRAEIDDALASGVIDSSTGVITYADAEKLPYLRDVVFEGIRMYPPLFGLKSKISPPGGDTIKDVYFPAGTEVCICDMAMCRRRDIFGDDADLFRPERWTEGDEEQIKRMRRTVEVIFGSGRFQCLGKHIAMMELHKVFVELLRNFDWMLATPLRGVTQVSHGVHHHTNMNMVARPRQR